MWPNCVRMAIRMLWIARHGIYHTIFPRILSVSTALVMLMAFVYCPACNSSPPYNYPIKIANVRNESSGVLGFGMIAMWNHRLGIIREGEGMWLLWCSNFHLLAKPAVCHNRKLLPLILPTISVTNEQLYLLLAVAAALLGARGRVAHDDI